ncbi:hypothetical protein CCACVL1_06658 [Corchorus capsularis]|uniref:Uncharacterized protein n=1 Tax=Corchorus capsularis TaxID=210143 RepID=A0A1R3JDY4_COCAP|nr:hypothetical protein CCACVL1_06658 [Corchorus capsularis]
MALHEPLGSFSYGFIMVGHRKQLLDGHGKPSKKKAL